MGVVDTGFSLSPFGAQPRLIELKDVGFMTGEHGQAPGRSQKCTVTPATKPGSFLLHLVVKDWPEKGFAFGVDSLRDRTRRHWTRVQ